MKPAALDKSSPVPLYKQVKSYLIDYIEKNKHKTRLLPTELEISRTLDVSRSTIRIATNELVSDGLIERVPGKGSFIAEDAKTVHFSTWLSLEEYSKKPLTESLELFERKNPEISVELTSFPYEKFEHQLMLMTAAGKAPDIASLVYFWLPAFAHQGALIPLDDFIDREARKDLHPSAVEAATYNGNIYGFTWASGPTILYWNKKILDEFLGLEKPAIESYEEFLAAAEKLYEKSGREIIPFAIPIADDELFFIYSVYNFLLAFGGGILDSGGEVMFHAQANIDAFTWLKRFIQMGHVDTAHDFRAARKLFAENRLAFSIEAPWFKEILPSLNAGFDLSHLGYSVLPAGPVGKPVSVLYNIILSVFTQSEQREEAAQLAAHLTKDRDSARWFYREAGLLPARQSQMRNDPAMSDEFGRVLQKQMEYAVPVPSNHPSFLLSIAFCARASRQILLENADPGAVLHQTAEVLEELYRR